MFYCNVLQYLYSFLSFLFMHFFSIILFLLLCKCFLIFLSFSLLAFLAHSKIHRDKQVYLLLIYIFFVVKPSIYQYWSAQYITILTPPTYQPRSLHGILLPYGMRYLILGWASHLDAFSVYPFHTQLLSYAIGMTTDKPSVCPSWSSRTKDSSPQISCACDR